MSDFRSTLRYAQRNLTLICSWVGTVTKSISLRMVTVPLDGATTNIRLKYRIGVGDDVVDPRSWKNPVTVKVMRAALEMEIQT